MQATVQATTKNIEILQETSTDENTVIASKFAQLRTSGNVASVDGMQGVTVPIPLPQPRRQPSLH